MEIAWIHSKALKVDSFVSDFVSDQFCTILNYPTPLPKLMSWWCHEKVLWCNENQILNIKKWFLERCWWRFHTFSSLDIPFLLHFVDDVAVLRVTWVPTTQRELLVTFHSMIVHIFLSSEKTFKHCYSECERLLLRRIKCSAMSWENSPTS